MPTTLLVTGGAGFIGNHFCRYALERDPGLRIVVLDRLSAETCPRARADLEAHPRYELVKGDVRDPATVRPLAGRVEAVVHLAAESHVDRSIEDASPFVTTNVVGTDVVLGAALAHGRRLLHVSTDEVYGHLPLEARDRRFTEASPLAPRSPYAASKAGADLLVLAACATHGADCVVTRCSNNFGPWQHPEKLIPRFVRTLAAGESVPLYGDGRHVRDWIHVLDHCEALWAVLERGAPGRVYNVGASNERSNLELTRAILSAFGAGPDRIAHVPDRPGHDRRYAVDATRLREELGWRPTRSAWPEALEATVAWYRAHPGWWEASPPDFGGGNS